MLVGTSSIYDAHEIAELQELEKFREPLGNAYGRLVEILIGKYLHGASRILEVGSGLGYFGRHLPAPFKGEWLQLEGQSAFMNQARKINPSGNYFLGDMKNLPFSDNSLDAIVGFNVFDLCSLDSVIPECHRVLKTGAHLLAVHDIVPSMYSFEEAAKAEKVLFRKFGAEIRPWKFQHYFNQMLCEYLQRHFAVVSTDSLRENDWSRNTPAGVFLNLGGLGKNIPNFSFLARPLKTVGLPCRLEIVSASVIVATK